MGYGRTRLPASQIERARVGNSLPKVIRAALLPDGFTWMLLLAVAGMARYSAGNSPAIFMRGGEPWLMTYCWSTYCHVTRSWMQLRILYVLGPSTTAYARHNFRHFGVDQQYPPVISTHAEQPPLGARACTKTQSRNECRVGRWSGSFWTAYG